MQSAPEPELLDEPRGLASALGTVSIRSQDLLGDPRRYEADRQRLLVLGQADDFVFVTSPEAPDAGTYSGEEGRQWITAWVESFEGHTIEATEIIDAGERMVVAMLQRGRPRGSQIAVEGRWWMVVTLREEAVVRLEIYPERTEALEAAGLSE